MTHKTLRGLTVLLGIIAFIVIVKILTFDFGIAEHIAPSMPHTESTFSPTEIFSGDIDGKPVSFEHDSFTRYRLTVGGVGTMGELNTERGFGDDIDATVFVLDWNKPESEQMYFVRLSSDSTSIVELDSARTLTSNKLFSLDAQTSPTVVGGDRDAHGCIGSAGYSWCEVKNKCLRVWEEACQ